MANVDKRPSRLIALPLAIVFLFETWIWRKLVALASAIGALLPWEAFRDSARRILGRLPAVFSVLLFGIPLVVSEGGAFISVVMMATGHVVMGMTLYVAMKIFGLFLVPIIFEITREKLLSLSWFAYLYEKFEALHAAVRRFVEPYKQAAKQMLREAAASARSAWLAFTQAPPSAARASAAKPETSTSSARAVGSSPASPSH